MNHSLTRRRFLGRSSLAAAGLGVASLTGCQTFGKKPEPFFKISLAEWSLHNALFGGQMTHMQFPNVAQADYGINAVELVNQFFKDKANDRAYLTEFKNRADTLGVRILLIMVDGEGSLGDPDSAARKQAVQNHFKWVEAAKFFGCHSIRVNADSKGVGSFEEQQDRAADGLTQLSRFAAGFELNVIVENHGGLSSNGEWLVGVMRKVNRPNCGTLPDFGNFNLGNGQTYDRYKGVAEMMPYAKAVSAKSHDFDAEGNEIHTDYRRMMKIVLDAGYHGYVGIEYEGSKVSEPEGIRLTKALLEKVHAEFWAERGA